MHAGAEGLGGRGATINSLVDDAATITDVLAAQRADIATAIDSFAAVGVGPGARRAPSVGALIDELATLTATVAGSRDRMVVTLAARSSTSPAPPTRPMLVPHADRLATMFAQLEPRARPTSPAAATCWPGWSPTSCASPRTCPSRSTTGRCCCSAGRSSTCRSCQDDGFSDDPIQALLEFLAQLGLGGGGGMIPRRVWVNLAVFFGLFAVLANWALRNVLSLDVIERPYSITATFESSPGLRANVEVTYLGVRVGTIDSIHLEPTGVVAAIDIDRGTELPTRHHRRRAPQVGRRRAVHRPRAAGRLRRRAGRSSTRRGRYAIPVEAHQRAARLRRAVHVARRPGGRPSTPAASTP